MVGSWSFIGELSVDPYLYLAINLSTSRNIQRWSAQTAAGNVPFLSGDTFGSWRKPRACLGCHSLPLADPTFRCRGWMVPSFLANGDTKCVLSKARRRLRTPSNSVKPAWLGESAQEHHE